MFNLALAHSRADELEEAKLHLERVTKIESRVKDRAKNLLVRIGRALEKGSDFNLNLTEGGAGAKPDAGAGAKEQNDEKAESSDELPPVSLEAMATVIAAPGDRGSFLIYLPASLDPDVAKLLENQPRFKKRDAIEREESAGADKALSAS